MISLFKKLFGRKGSASFSEANAEKARMPDSVQKIETYAQARDVARSGSKESRLDLASNEGTHKEILYYMAEHDPDPAVRRAVASNVSTPLHVSAVLAKDSDIDVRLALGERLCALLPDLNEDETSQIYAYAVQALATLALDEVIKIRKALASALKDHAHAPPKVAGQLARDIEREVSEPILRFCTVLSDQDLIDILKKHPQSWAVQAIASRETVSEPVSEAVIDTDDVESGKMLLKNEGAQISHHTIEAIIEKSREYEDWQAPLALNKNLPSDMARELAEFAGESVRELLEQRVDFDDDVKVSIIRTFKRRLNFADEGARDKDADAATRVKRFADEENLTEEVIIDALGMRDNAFVFAALAHLAKTPEDSVRRVFSLQTAKPIVALCWKAGLSMRLALQLQKEVGHVQPKELLYPREGESYPLDEEELLWQLDFVGIK